MTRSPLEGRSGLVSFRLSDVPIEVRRAAARPLLAVFEDSYDLTSAIALTRAVESPGEGARWIPRAAWEAARAKRLWQKAVS